MIFHRARLKLQNTTIDLKMGDCNLNKANNLKYLGVIIDDTISWVHHITYIKKIRYPRVLASCLKQVNTSREKVFLPCTIPIYISLYDILYDCHLYQLYIIQKKVIRLISFTNYDSPSAVTFKNQEILPLNKLVYNRIGIMMYKYSNNLLPPEINDLYASNNNVQQILYSKKTFTLC